jgi:hypothetical protein
MYRLSLRSAEHVRRYSICQAARSGWEVILEEDRTLRRRDHYEDWHRVERALALFEREVSALTADGWLVATDALVDEPVAEPDHGLDLASGLSQLATQPSDVDVH